MVARWTDGIQEGSAPGAIRHNPGEESRSNDGHVEEANNKGRSIERSKRARVHWKTEKLSNGKRKIGAGKKAKTRKQCSISCAKGSLLRRCKENELRLLLHLMHSLRSSSSFSASSLLGPGPRTDYVRGKSTASTRLVVDHSELH
eukprot:scaffold894_cov153-Cylindrotheca_fusiformis.AAC.22